MGNSHAAQCRWFDRAERTGKFYAERDGLMVRAGECQSASVDELHHCHGLGDVMVT
jgi:hypothetical protein